MNLKSNKILRWTGLITFLVGVGLSILMYLSQAWPTYLFFLLCGIGIIQVVIAWGFKNIKTTWQFFWSVLPFLTLYVLLAKDSPSHDIFVIPENFRGQVVIEYGVHDGTKKEYEGKWRVYKVPENGHLKTRFTLKGNAIRLSGSKYYFVDNKGNRKRIKHYCEHCEDKDTTSFQVIHGTLETNKNTSFQHFIIDIPNSDNKKNTSLQKTIERLDNE